IFNIIIEKDLLIFNNIIFSYYYYAIKFNLYQNINILYSNKLEISFINKINNFSYYMNIIYYFKNFYFNPFYKIDGLFFQIGINIIF
ncbi:MAG: hypothetical protein N3A58_06520, partial [Spirochaetes bacterium]|nr:hypothetical protein [Spirochaetota bacterium]